MSYEKTLYKLSGLRHNTSRISRQLQELIASTAEIMAETSMLETEIDNIEQRLSKDIKALQADIIGQLTTPALEDLEVKAPLPKLDDLGFSVRVQNVLCFEGIDTTEKLLECTCASLMRKRNFSRGSLRNVTEQLAKHGLKLK